MSGLLLTALEPERPGRTGAAPPRCWKRRGRWCPWSASTPCPPQLLYKLMVSFTAQFGASMQLNTLLQEQRLKTIFENPNVFAGAGAAILLSLGLADGAEDRKERCLHLSCLLLNSTAFLLAVSRGAMAAIAAAFLLYLLMERGQRRAVSFILMVETLVLAAAASLAVLPAYAAAWGEGTDPAPAGRCGRSGGPVRTGHLRGPSAGPAHGPADEDREHRAAGGAGSGGRRRGTGGELDRPHRQAAGDSITAART